MNGLAVGSEYCGLGSYQTNRRCKRSFVAEFYSLPEPIDTYSSGGVSAIGGDIAGDLGFTGKTVP